MINWYNVTRHSLYLVTRSTIKLIYSDKETPMNPLNEGYRPVLEQDKLITPKKYIENMSIRTGIGS
jgi:hypothetical protein